LKTNFQWHKEHAKMAPKSNFMTILQNVVFNVSDELVLTPTTWNKCTMNYEFLKSHNYKVVEI